MKLFEDNGRWWIENEGEKIELKPNLPELKKNEFGYYWWFQDGNKREVVNTDNIHGGCDFCESLFIEIEQIDLFTDTEKGVLIEFFGGHEFTAYFDGKYEDTEGKYDFDKHFTDLHRKVKLFKTYDKRKFVIDKIIEDIERWKQNVSSVFLSEFEQFVKPKLIELYLKPDKVNYNTDGTKQPDDSTDQRINYSKIQEFKQSQQPTTEIPPTKTKILFLTANPRDEQSLRLEGELRKVLDVLDGATHKNSLDYKIEPAVRIDIITKAMQTQKPEIVHFSGHGCIEGLAVEDDSGYSDLFPVEGLDRLFRLFKETTKCVILNACDSKDLAKTISKHGIHVIGMNDEIGDEAARKFAVGFYQSLGEGKDYEFAFEIGMVHISNEYDDANIPELWFNGGRIKN